MESALEMDMNNNGSMPPMDMMPVREKKKNEKKTLFNPLGREKECR